MADEAQRNSLHTHASWNCFRFGIPFAGAIGGLSVIYGMLAQVDPVWALGPLLFALSGFCFAWGWRREFAGLKQEPPLSGEGSWLIFNAVVILLVGIFAPALLSS